MELVEKATREVLPVNFDNVPDELKDSNQIVVWKYELVEGDLKKPPFDPKTGRRASVRNPSTWGTFNQARRAYETGEYAGIGYMLTGGLVAFDVDHCIIDGNLNEVAEWLVRYLGTYAEASPSGTGIRILIRGNKPGVFSRKGSVEVYETDHYVTLTGHWIANTPMRIMADQMKLQYAYRKVFESSLTQQRPQQENRRYKPQNLAHEIIIKKALNSKNGKVFARYWNGDSSLWEGPGALEGSPSDADWQLVLYLMYWTNGNSDLVDELFRRSGLKREKWDRRANESETYGQMTRRKALAKYLEDRENK